MKRIKIDLNIFVSIYRYNPNILMNFTPAQQAAFESYLNGENIFITGSGGVGKSYFIQQVYKHAKENGKNIRVTAMTGCSAILLPRRSISGVVLV